MRNDINNQKSKANDKIKKNHWKSSKEYWSVKDTYIYKTRNLISNKYNETMPDDTVDDHEVSVRAYDIICMT